MKYSSTPPTDHVTLSPTTAGKRRCALAILPALCLGMASCASGPNAQTGTVLGGLGGAAAGGIIGHQSGRGLEGAAIGGALGAVGGNAVGNAQDQRNYYRRY